MDDVKSRIKARGYWELAFHPVRPLVWSDKTLPELDGVIRESRVELRGWDYPHIPRDGIRRKADSVFGETEWENHKEVWELYRSGQFLHLLAFKEDWFLESPRTGQQIAPGAVMSIFSILYTLTEFFMFAGRVAGQMGFIGAISLTYRLKQIQGRQLVTLDPRRAPLDEYHRADVSMPEYGETMTASSDALVGRNTEMALDTTLKVFAAFHWDPPRAQIAEDQQRFIDRRS